MPPKAKSEVAMDRSRRMNPPPLQSMESEVKELRSPMIRSGQSLCSAKRVSSLRNSLSAFSSATAWVEEVNLGSMAAVGPYARTTRSVDER